MLFSNKITIFSQPHQKLSPENLATKNFLADSFTIPPKSRIYQIAARGKLAIGDGVLWISPCKRKAKPEAQLGDSEIKAMSLGGSVVARIHR